jgi:capsular exopolysaccharide synthesis family protein
VELREAIAALRVAWWVPVLGLVVGAGVALGVSLAQTPLYTSSMQFFVSTTGGASTSEVYQGSQFSQQRVTSYARVLDSRLLADRVVERLDLDVSARELTERITSAPVASTVLIDVSLTDTSPDQAQRVAEVLGEEFIERVAELETPTGGGDSLVRVAFNELPNLPSEPSTPQTLRNVSLGGILGLFVGAGLAIVRAQLDRSVKSAEEAAVLVGAPVVGTVLRDGELEKRHTVDRKGASRTAEDYRQLRNNLQFLDVDNPPKLIMISSALPSEGKTTAVVNLALALVDAGKRVTVIEADLRRPKVSLYLGMVAGVGLTNLLAGTAELDDVLQYYGDAGLQVVAAGPTPPNPGELLASSHMAELLNKLRDTNDFVLIDAPPLLPVADSSGLAVHTDGVLLSVRYGATRREQLQQAAATLERVGARTLGIILNIVPPKAGVASAYGYGYSYEAEPVKGRRRP